MKTERAKRTRRQSDPETMKKPASRKTPVMKSRSAFIRALPQISRRTELIRQWVLFVGSRLVANASTKLELITLCQERGIPLLKCYIGFVRCFDDSREEIESVDSPSLQLV